MRKSIASFALIGMVFVNTNIYGMRSVADLRADLMSETEKIVEHIKCHPLCFQYLNEICNNTIGRTTLELLSANLKVNEKVLYLCLGDHNGFDGKNIITINPTYFDSAGRSKYTLCGILNGEMVGIHETISEAIFLELCCALHRYAGIEMEGSTLLDSIMGIGLKRIYGVTMNVCASLPGIIMIKQLMPKNLIQYAVTCMRFSPGICLKCLIASM